MPLKQLVEFERLSDIGPGKSTAVTFSLDPYVSLSLTAANGSKVVYPVRALGHSTPTTTSHTVSSCISEGELWLVELVGAAIVRMDQMCTD